MGTLLERYVEPCCRGMGVGNHVGVVWVVVNNAGKVRDDNKQSRSPISHATHKLLTFAFAHQSQKKGMFRRSHVAYTSDSLPCHPKYFKNIGVNLICYSGSMVYACNDV